LDTYMDALRHFPSNADHIQTAQGKANLIKKDIFRNLMWYAFSGSSKHYPMTIERVKEIIDLNKQGIFPEELQAVELEATAKEKLKIDVGFVNDVGQITLKNLEKRKSKSKNKKPNKTAAPNLGNKPEQKQNRAQGAETAPKNNNPKPRENRPNTARPHNNADANLENAAAETRPSNNNNPNKTSGNNRNRNNRKPRPEAAARTTEGNDKPSSSPTND